MGRIYTVTFDAVTVANSGGDQDLFEVTPADDKPVKFMGFTFDNVGGTADAGDAQEELLRLAVIRGHTTSGTGGSAATPRKLASEAGAAAGFTAEVNNTTIASAGTPLTLWAGGVNVRVPGTPGLWPEEAWPGASQADTTMVVRLLSTVADDIVCSGTLYVVEEG